MTLRVAIVCPDERLRMSAARVFDDAPAEWDVDLYDTSPPAGAADVTVAVATAIEGAIPLELDHPNRALERIALLSAGTDRQIVHVFGAVGGCGATTLSLHLAAACREPACVLALDPVDLTLRLGLEVGELGPAPVPAPGFIKVATYPGDDPAAMAGFRDRFRSVIVDRGREAIDRGPLSVNTATVSVIVLTPTIPAARRAALLLEQLGDSDVAIVTNRVGPGSETTRAELERLLGRRIALELPCSPRLRDREDDGVLLAGWSRWTWRVRELAGAIGLA